MPPRARPFGVSIIAVVVAVKGLASLAMAFDLLILDLASSKSVDEPGAGIELVTGLLLLYKARGLSRLEHRTWQVVVVFLAIDIATAIGELLIGTRTVTVWLSLFLAAGTELYLLSPNVREAFSRDRTNL